VDWDAVERDYRTGRFTLRELEAKHGAKNSTIARRAAREDWKKDLTAAVRQATNAGLIQAIVTEKCSTAQQNAAGAVLAAAEVNKQVILGHRADIAHARAVAAGLLRELQDAALLGEHAETLARVLAGEQAGSEAQDDSGLARARTAVARALGVGARIGGLRGLAEAMARLQTLERQAFNIEPDQGHNDDHLSALLVRIQTQGSHLPVVREPDSDGD
jgi:hypothetical protein